MISIIIPIYNIESYLDEALHSVMLQSYSNYEVLMIDDGSTDSSSEVCKKYMEKDNRFKYYYKKNGGLSSARNYGIDLARGNYLFFLDGDDYLHYRTLEYLMTEATYSDMVMVKVKVVSDDTSNESIILQQSALNGRVLASKKEMLEGLYSKKPLEYIVVWNKLYRKSMFDSIRFPEGKLHEDEFVNYLLYDLCEQVSILDFEGYFYRVRQGSITQSKFNIKRLDSIDAFIERQLFFEEKAYFGFCKKNIDLLIYNYYSRLQLVTEMNNEIRKAFKGKKVLISNLLKCSNSVTNKQKLCWFMLSIFIKIRWRI